MRNDADDGPSREKIIIPCDLAEDRWLWCVTIYQEGTPLKLTQRGTRPAASNFGLATSRKDVFGEVGVDADTMLTDITCL